MECPVERLRLKQIECRRGSHDEPAKQPLNFHSPCADHVELRLRLLHLSDCAVDLNLVLSGFRLRLLALSSGYNAAYKDRGPKRGRVQGRCSDCLSRATRCLAATTESGMYRILLGRARQF